MRAAGEQTRCVQEGPRLVFVGSPLLDVTAAYGVEDLPGNYSLVPDGCVPATSAHDDLFRLLLRDPGSRLDAGGSALNSAKVAKWALGEQGQVAFAGCVGDDECGARLESDLRLGDVEPLLVALSGQSTGACACFLGSGGQRSMCTRRGASAHFSKRHLQVEAIEKWLKTSRCVFLVGYFAAHSPDVVVAVADRLTRGQLFALSLSAEYICRDFKEVLLQVLPRVDVLFGNEGELAAFAAAALGMRESFNADRAASAVAAMMAGASGTVVVTRGSDDIILVNKGGRPRHFAVPETAVVDGVGCGDALAGAFLAVYVLTGDAERAARAGIKAAAEIARVPGCRPPAEAFTY